MWIDTGYLINRFTIISGVGQFIHQPSERINLITDFRYMVVYDI